MEFPTPERIDCNGVQLEVFTAGSGRPLVLCHGWPEHAFSWRHQIAPLAAAGYQVIVPNQRGYGNSSRPGAVTDYDITHLCGDLTALLDHYGHERAVFVGHDWGAIVVWNLGLLHPQRMAGLINLSVPFLERGSKDWVSVWEELLGQDFYIVHFNRQPGVADAVFLDNNSRFLRNLYRTKQWLAPMQASAPGMPLLNLARSDTPSGELMMSEAELDVFVSAFAKSGYTGGINWYRNFTRNWELTAGIEPRIDMPALMIYGQYDIVPPMPNLTDYAPQVETHTLPCGHWIQQEEPQRTTELMLDWLARHYPTQSDSLD